MTVNQILAAIKQAGLSGDDEIVIRSIEGDVIDSKVEVNGSSVIIRADIISSDDDFSDCGCGQ